MRPRRTQHDESVVRRGAALSVSRFACPGTIVGSRSTGYSTRGIPTGGVGKTRLAIELARDLLNELSDGVWLVDLAPLSATDLVAQTIATALGIREEQQRSVRGALVERLRDRELLLV